MGQTLKAAGDDRLAGTRYDWLRNLAAMEPQNRKEFAELRTRGQRLKLQLISKEVRLGRPLTNPRG